MLKTLAYSHALDVLALLGEEARRFTDIERELELNPNFVNMRLKDLRRIDLVEKDSGKYRITDKGQKALRIGQELNNIAK